MNFKKGELGFIYSCLTSLKYENEDDKNEKNYNKRIDKILLKIAEVLE